MGSRELIGELPGLEDVVQPGFALGECDGDVAHAILDEGNAEEVIAPVGNWRLEGVPNATNSFTPSISSARPRFPDVQSVDSMFVSVPVLPFPEKSVAVVEVPSSKLQ